MITRKLIISITVLGLFSAARAQSDATAEPIQIRAVLHDPTNPSNTLFIPDASDGIVKLGLRRGNLSNVQLTRSVNGAIPFYNAATIDPEKPMENLVAMLKVSPELKSVIVILVPNPTDSKYAMSAVLIDDTEEGFPKGESRLLSMIPVEVGILAGEHRVSAEPGKITRIPAVEKHNEFNIASTSFYYKKNGKWVVFSERQVKYSDKLRRIYLIAAPKGASSPYVTTIIDAAVYKPPVAP